MMSFVSFLPSDQSSNGVLYKHTPQLLLLHQREAWPGRHSSTTCHSGSPRAEAPDWTALVQTLEVDYTPKALVFSPNGKTIAGSSRGTIQLWDLTTGDSKLQIHSLDMKRVAFSPDNNILASVSQATISFWDTATGERLRDIKTVPPIETRVAFSPNSQRLVFGSYRGLHLFKVSTGEEELFFELHDVRVKDIVFVPDGERVLILQQHDNLWLSVSLIDMIKGEQRQLNCGHGGPDSVALSPIGTTRALSWRCCPQGYLLSRQQVHRVSFREQFHLDLGYILIQPKANSSPCY
ncbi:Quino protein amine dehydrogenase [Aspergillus keveii]|uniref:Quino protein amine dehydrogenase n=1 Tax=Aspergillus keveii TaxID=714993 RepID=A0ABR4FJC1_9EURO